MSEFINTYNTRASLGTGYLEDSAAGYGAKWRQNDTKAAQGYYYNTNTNSYFIGQRIGVIYMGDVSDSIPDGSSIQSIELKITNSGGAANTEKTLKIRKSFVQGNVNSDSTAPKDYLIKNGVYSDELGTITKNFTGGGKVDTIVLSSSSNASLFNNLVEYFKDGNNTIVLFNNDDTSTTWSDNSGGTYTPYTYIVIRSIEMTVTYLKPYTVTFRANGGKFSDSTTIQTLTKYEGQDFTIPYYNMSKNSVSSNFTITGVPNNSSSNITQQATKTETFSFSGWNTVAGGSGDSYNYNSKYINDANITLYAQYTKNSPTYTNNTIGNDWFSISKANVKQATYTVTFNKNGGNCSVSSYDVDKIRRYTLDGWYSENNGSGTKYSKGKAFTSATTLYANWNYTDITDGIILPQATKNSVSTNFDIIGISEYSSKTQTATKTETFSFSGWNTASGGSGTSYNGGSAYAPSKNITLYAQYTKNSPTYTNNTIGNDWFSISKEDTIQATYITTFDSNGGSCDTSSISVDKIRSYTFNGWWSGENGTGTKYSKGKAFTSATTLYANWNYTDTTDSITLPLATRAGYDFLYWNTSSDGTGAEIKSPYTPTASDTLYAIYDPKGLIRIYDEENKKWNEALIFVYTQSSWKQVIPHIYDGESWKIGV